MSGYHCIEVRSDSLCKQVARIAQELAWSETNSSGNPELPVLREDGVSCLMNVHVSPPGGSHDAHMEGAYTYSACMCTCTVLDIDAARHCGRVRAFG